MRNAFYLPIFSLVDVIQILPEILFLSLLSCLHGVVKARIGAEIHLLSLELQPRAPFPGALIPLNPTHTAGIRSDRRVTSDAADLRTVHVSCLFAHFYRGIASDAVTAHTEIGICQRIGRLVGEITAITAAFPKRNGASTARSALVRSPDDHEPPEAPSREVVLSFLFHSIPLPSQFFFRQRKGITCVMPFCCRPTPEGVGGYCFFPKE